MAAEHLLQKGVEHFAFIGLPGLRYCDERLLGFSETLSRHACTCDVFWVGGRTLPKCLVQSEPYIHIISSVKKPVSIFATNDRVGFGVLLACQQLRLLCPDTVSLIAVDNDDILCSLATPQMSSIHIASEKIGYRAAELLAGMMEGQQPRALWEEIIPHSVIQRHSSDVMRVGDPLVAEALRVIRSRREEGLNVPAVLKTLPGSRRTLERKFQETLGHGIYDEIRRSRIERAQELLRESNLSIAKISRAVGFNSVTRFGITFREQVGINASDYRNTKKKVP
jgi:LacI family transcriptional regulator